MYKKEFQLSTALKQLLSEYYMNQHFHSYGHNEDTIYERSLVCLQEKN
jgi:hypothetical protein